MKSLSSLTLASLSGGIANPVFKHTLHDPVGTGAMQYENDCLYDYYLFADKGADSGFEHSDPVMRTMLCFSQNAEVEITRSPSAQFGYVITILASEYPVKGAFNNTTSDFFSL